MFVIVEAVDPETGKTVQMECAVESEDEIRDLLPYRTLHDTGLAEGGLMDSTGRI